jgi:hypothetical protein
MKIKNRCVAFHAAFLEYYNSNLFIDDNVFRVTEFASQSNVKKQTKRE